MAKELPRVDLDSRLRDEIIILAGSELREQGTSPGIQFLLLLNISLTIR